MSLSIRPINTGMIKVDVGIHITQGRNVGNKTFIPALAWLIQGGEKLILVDTGMAETKMADWHHKGSYQDEGMDICSQLKKIGVDPAEIDLIIFTHLHWDHCYHMKKFVNAEYLVHKKELEFALDPIPPYYRSYESPVLGMEPPFHNVTFKVVEGEEQIIPGVTVFPTPGHSPGHQSVEVLTESGNYIIAGDAVFTELNLKGAPDEKLPYLPIGRFTSYLEMWDSLDKIAKRSNLILPGHDLKVLEKEVYK